MNGATFSPCRTWRYVLDRSWDAMRPGRLLVVMLNPSTADESADDPTIRRLTGFARSWLYGGMRILNLFALCATDPRELYTHPNPVGPENDFHLRENLEGTTLPGGLTFGRVVLAAWGVHGGLQSRAFKVQHLVDGVKWGCLGVTKSGAPRHPLYVPKAQEPIAFGGGGG